MRWVRRAAGRRRGRGRWRAGEFEESVHCPAQPIRARVGVGRRLSRCRSGRPPFDLDLAPWLSPSASATARPGSAVPTSSFSRAGLASLVTGTIPPPRPPPPPRHPPWSVILACSITSRLLERSHCFLPPRLTPACHFCDISCLPCRWHTRVPTLKPNTAARVSTTA